MNEDLNFEDAAYKRVIYLSIAIGHKGKYQGFGKVAFIRFDFL